jgi:hypothetical protein
MELGTTDQAGAKRFYTSLFGWSPDDMPMGPDAAYTMFKLDGEYAAAAYQLDAAMRSMGIPSHWMLYISVANADESSRKASDLGGEVVKGPFDVFDAGRMSVIKDPTGVMFCIWQAGRNQGVGLVGEEGAFCWADLSTSDEAKAKEFYAGLFGWKIEASPNDPSGYLHIQNGADFIGGIQPSSMRNPHAPPHWLIYFQTSDCDGSVSKAQEHGATIHLPPMSLPNVGRFAVVADPQGASFALFEPQNAA